MAVLGAEPDQPGTDKIIHGRPGVESRRATINVSEQAAREKVSPRTWAKSKPNVPLRGRPTGVLPPGAQERASRMDTPMPATLDALDIRAGGGGEATLAAADVVAQGSFTGTPPLSASFRALLDDGTPGTFNPDTQGAVGHTHLVVAANTEVRTQTRDGSIVQTLSLDGFWSSIGAFNVFDPRLLYDPYGQRWIMAAEADPAGNNPLLLIGVSQSSNPAGAWNLYSVDVNASGPFYAEAPNLGFNKNWIAVQADIFNSTNFFFERSDIYVFDKADLYAGGVGFPTVITVPSDDVATHVPAATYDPDLEVLHLMANFNGNFDGFGYLRTYTISGVFPTLELIRSDVFPFADAWADFIPNFRDILPQLGSTRKIYGGDARLANVVYREGTLYAAHTIFLPPNNPGQAAVQWWEVTPGGSTRQTGRIESAGNVDYAYPSVAVNRNLEMLIGFNRFASNRYAGGWYNFRDRHDVPGSLRQVTLLKDGEAPYYKPNFYTNNVWGDWSASTVDPLNDTELWTVQEYASLPVNSESRWGLWWGRVTPPDNLAITGTDAPDPIFGGEDITYTLTVTNIIDDEAFPRRAEDVVVTNTLPVGVQFVSVNTTQGTCSQAGNRVICQLGRFDDLASATISIVARALTIGNVTNIAIVSGRGPEADPADNTAVIVTRVDPAVDLGVTVAASPNPVHVGSDLSYSIAVTNRGPSTATGVIVTNTIPPGTTFISATPSVGTFTRTGQNVIWTIDSLAVGASPSMALVARPTTPGMMTNRTVLRTTAVETRPADNVTTNVVRANALPTISDNINRTIAEDGSTVVNLTVGDLETLANNLVVTASSANQGLVPNANLVPGGADSSRTLMISPLPNQFGSAVITIFVTDSDGAMASDPFTLTVASVNDQPTLNTISDVSVNEDSGSRTVTLTGITGGPGNEPQAPTVSATSSLTSVVPNPTVTAVSGGSATLTFNPVANASGVATIMVTVNDGGTSNNVITRNFNITVNPVNDPPSMNALGNLNLAEDAGLQQIPLTGITSGAANESDTISITVGQDNPSVLRDLAVSYTSGTSGTLSFNTVAEAAGSSTVTVTLNDNRGSNNIGQRMFTVNVGAVNDPPTINSISDLNLLEDAAPQTVTLSGIGSGANNENQSLTVTATSSIPTIVTGLAVNYTSPNSGGTLSFNLAPNANGNGSITVTVRDDGASNNVATRMFNVNVTAVNDAPTLDTPAPLPIPEDAPTQRITLTGISEGASNEGSQALSFSAISSNTSIIPNPTILYTNGQNTGVLRFTPVPDAFGQVTITITASDNGGTVNGGRDTTVRMFTVDVQSMNDLPTISTITRRTINEDSSAGIAFTVSDVETPLNLLTLSGSSSDLSIVPASAFNFTGPGTDRNADITPVADQFGEVTASITVRDQHGGSATENFVLTISGVNDPPTLDPIAPFQIPEDAGQQSILLTGLSGGPANEPQNLTVTASSGATSLIPTPTISYTNGQSTGVLRFTSAANSNGVATLTVRVNDGGGSNNLILRMFDVAVTDVNDPPVIGMINNQSTAEDTDVTVLFTIGDAETPAANLSLRADSFNEELIAATDLSFGGSGENPTLRIRPLPDQSGSAIIAVTVTDPSNEMAQVFFEVLVNPANDPPAISDIGNQSMNEDSTRTVFFTVSDAETVESALSLSASSPNTTLLPPGSLALGQTPTNRTLAITPAPNQFGTTTVNVVVSDGETNATRSFTLAVNPVNDLPTITSPGPVTTDEDTSTPALTIMVGDLETPAGSLILSALSSNPTLISAGGFTFGGSAGSRTLTIRPQTNQFGNAQVTVFVRDLDNGTNSTNFAVTVRSVDDLPIISDVTNRSTAEDTQIDVPFQVGDPDSSADGLTVSGTSSNQQLIPDANFNFSGIGSNRTVTLTPRPNVNGTATITLNVTDPTSSSRSDTFVLTVTSVNDAPTVSIAGGLTTAEDTMSVTQAVTVGDIETAAGTLTLTATSSNTALIPVANVIFGGSGSNRTVRVSPGTNQFGVTTVMINVSDGTNVTSQPLTVTVTPVNDAPTFNVINNVTVPEDAPLQNVSLSGISAGPNETGQPLTITAVSDNPTLIPNPAVTYTSPSATGTLSFTPQANASGVANIMVTITDGQSQNNTFSRNFTITVTSSNDAPTISAIVPQTTLEDTPVTASFNVGDIESNPTLVSITGTSSNTTLVANSNIVINGSGANRTVTITPSLNQTGSTFIGLTASDGISSSVSTFQINVVAVNDRPTLNPLTNQFFNVNPGNVTIPLSGISSGATNETDTLTVTVSSSAGLSFSTAPAITYTSPNATGSLTFRPGNNQTGSSTITVTVNDGRGSNNLFTQSFVVGVKATANTLPTISTIANQTTSEDTRIDVPFTARDNETAAITLSALSLNPVLLPQANISFGGSGSNRTVTLTPATNLSGSAAVIITVTDGAGGGTNRSFTLTVNPVNDVPTISAIPSAAVGENTPAGPLDFTVRDVETSPGSLTLSSISGNTTLVPNGNIVFGGSGSNRTVTVTPAANRTGVANIMVTVSDGTSSATTNFTVTVSQTPPAIMQISLSTGNVRISWPVAAGDWVLQFSDNLTTGWTDVGGSPVVIGDQNTVTQSASQATRLYRLRRR